MPGLAATSTVKAITLQNDGKILIGGAFTKYNNIIRNRIARLNSDGTLDTSFDPGTGANAIINTLALQTDGKIIAGGDFITFNSLTANRLVRLTTTGAADAGFDAGAGANAAILATTLQTNGHILVGGSFTSYNNIGRNRAARVFGQLITSPSISTSNLTSAGICPGGTVNESSWVCSGYCRHHQCKQPNCYFLACCFGRCNFAKHLPGRYNLAKRFRRHFV